MWPPLAIRSAQKIGSSVIDPCGNANVHSPSQSSVPVTLIAGTLEALLDRLACRHAVVGDAPAEHREAALVDELAVGVDHRLDRSLRQPLDLPVDDLDRPVDQPLLQASSNTSSKGLDQVVAASPAGSRPAA